MFAGLWLTSFFQGLSTGFWFPALTNILNAKGMGEWVGWAFAVPPVCALFSPLIGGALADERVPAQKLLGWCSLAGAVLLFLAFGALDAGFGPIWFLALLAAYSTVSGPAWGLLATISMTHLGAGGRSYPLVRVGATVGWIAAGFLTSYALHADASPASGYAGAAGRIACGIIALCLPHTPPLGLGKSWKSALGLGAFSLFKNRDHAVLFTVTGLFSIPLVAFYMYAPELFEALGDETPTASMTIAQWSEIAAMVFLGALMVRYRLKTLLMWGLGLSALRFAMSGYAGWSGILGWHTAGVALHGVCYTIYFVTAQVYLDRRVEPALRGQAQGLLSLMAAGIGPLAGAFFCKWLRAACVDGSGRGWETFWGVLAAIIVGCWAAFGIVYRGKKAGE
ncbi:MFS transporter [Akkermansiaceae bacterium]|nr:MFS transporter [Akkermansiaceae bacterium]